MNVKVNGRGKRRNFLYFRGIGVTGHIDIWLRAALKLSLMVF